MRLVFALLLLSLRALSCVRSGFMDDLVSRADIFYQRPLKLGEPRELLMAEVENLDARKQLKVIIHGFSSSRTHTSITPLRHAYMEQDDAHVFLADWSDAAASDYLSARSAVGLVARRLATVLQDFLNKHRLPTSELHVIGHSLGAHVAGCIGSHMNGTLGRVTGLDPALPGFTPHSPDGLAPAAAAFVDVVHTDFPVFGDITPRGSADFYPHFGRTPQPGCGDLDLGTLSRLIFQSYSCSHNRAVLLFAESIKEPNSFPALPCPMRAIRLGLVAACYERSSVASADGRVVYMGEEVSRDASGSYYLDTNAAPPFGMRDV